MGETELPRLLRLPEMCDLLGVCRQTIWRRVRDKKLPEPVDLGGGISAWRSDQLRNWLDNKTPAAAD